MISNNDCKGCTKITEPTSENYCHDCTDYPEIDKARLKYFIKKDNYVKFLFTDLRSKGHSTDCALEILHSTFSEDNSLLNSYRML